MDVARAPTRTLAWIQALRGIAALMVVACHLRVNFIGTAWQNWTDTHLVVGAMGVDLFFMVSGFIMVYTTRNAPDTGRYAVGFLIKRFARIWPVYAIVVLITIVPIELFDLTMPGLPPRGIGDVIKSLLFAPVDPRKPMYYDLPYPVGWTLNFEVYFYVVFGASLLAGKARWLVFFGWMVATLAVLPYILSGTVSMDPLHDYRMPFSYLDLMTNSIIWEFVVGVIVGMTFLGKWRLGPPSLGWILVLVATVFALWWPLSLHTVLFHGITRWGWPLAVAFMLMALSFKHREPQVPKVLTWLGSVSFSLYLVHFYVLIAARVVAGKLGFANAIPTVPFCLFQVALSLLLAEASRRCLEDGLSERVRARLLTLTPSQGRSAP